MARLRAKADAPPRSRSALSMPGRLESKRIGIFIDFQFEDLEVTYPKIRLEEEGATVVVIGVHPAGMKYAGKHGLQVKSSKQVDEMAADGTDLDGLVLPGGFAPDYMRRSPRMLSIISGMVAAQKPVAAICHGCVASVPRARRIHPSHMAPYRANRCLMHHPCAAPRHRCSCSAVPHALQRNTPSPPSAGRGCSARHATGPERPWPRACE